MLNDARASGFLGRSLKAQLVLGKAVFDGGDFAVFKLFVGSGLHRGHSSRWFFSACQRGRLDFLHVIQDVGAAAVNAVDPVAKLTPLRAASQRGHCAVVRFLLAHGAGFAGEEAVAQTSFDLAVAGGHEDVVREFLKCADLPPAHAPLLAAIRKKHIRVMRLLLADGRIAAGSDAFIEAARCGFAEGIAALFVQLGIPDFQGRPLSPLHAAVHAGRPEVVAAILESGRALVNFPDREARVPLHYAALAGIDAIIEMLLDIDEIDVNVRDLHGQTPLHFAAENGRGACVAKLLARPEVEATARDRDGRTPLHLAVIHCQRAVVAVLLANGVDVPDGRGFTPLHSACDHGFYEIVCLLVRSGASLAERTPDEWTALHLAARNGHADVAGHLIGKAIGLLNEKTRDGQTALHLACIGRSVEAVRVLIEEDGILANERAGNGKTALHFAATFGFTDGVKLLLDSGKVDAEIKDDRGVKAVDLARKYRRAGVTKLLEAMERNRNDPETQQNS
jgi:ankyrin repeat protein